MTEKQRNRPLEGYPYINRWFWAVPPDILTIAELYDKLYGKPPSGMAWRAYVGAVAGGKAYDMSLLLPPGTPDSITKVYWSAAEAILKDPEFRRSADAVAGAGARWGAGEAYQKDFRLDFGADPEVFTWIKSELAKYGVVVE